MFESIEPLAKEAIANIQKFVHKIVFSSGVERVCKEVYKVNGKLNERVINDPYMVVEESKRSLDMLKTKLDMKRFLEILPCLPDGIHPGRVCNPTCNQRCLWIQ